MNCRKCSTMFDFSNRRCFICRIGRIPEGCLRRQYSIFLITRTLAGSVDDYSICRIGRISKYWLFGRCSIWCRISEDILLMLWQCSSRISEDVQQCSFSRRWLKITEDALFIEQGRFPRQCSVCRISRMAEDVRQRSHFSRRLPKMSIRSFPRVSKDRTSK